MECCLPIRSQPMRAIIHLEDGGHTPCITSVSFGPTLRGPLISTHFYFFARTKTHTEQRATRFQPFCSPMWLASCCAAIHQAVVPLAGGARNARPAHTVFGSTPNAVVHIQLPRILVRVYMNRWKQSMENKANRENKKFDKKQPSKRQDFSLGGGKCAGTHFSRRCCSVLDAEYRADGTVGLSRAT